MRRREDFKTTLFEIRKKASGRGDYDAQRLKGILQRMKEPIPKRH